MKTILTLVLLAFCAAQHAHAQGAAGAIAKQRAKEVVNQNNVRQGVNAPSGSPAVTPVQPQKADPVAKLKAEIATITGRSSVSADQKKQLAATILACARGSKKPTSSAVEKFSSGLADAIVGKSIEPGVQSRLASDINLAVNSASLSAQRTTQISDDVQAILQTAGLTRSVAVSVTGNISSMMAELKN